MSCFTMKKDETIPLAEALRKMPGRKMFVHVPVGDCTVDLEVEGVYSFSLHRGEIVLKVKS